MEAVGEFLAEGGGGFVFREHGAGFVVEMARAFDCGVLQVVGPGVDLAGAAFRKRFQI